MATLLLTAEVYVSPLRPELVSGARLIERLNAGLQADHYSRPCLSWTAYRDNGDAHLKRQAP